MWALPRMEEVPILTCPLHPIKEKDEEGVARALTPTKAIPVSSAVQNPEALVLPGNERISQFFHYSLRYFRDQKYIHST